MALSSSVARPKRNILPENHDAVDCYPRNTSALVRRPSRVRRRAGPGGAPTLVRLLHSILYMSQQVQTGTQTGNKIRESVHSEVMPPLHQIMMVKITHNDGRW
ncbi:hypothetical protein EVAR_22255_1 [Eumeta japonica]|uniref:Uncharacterized protein n=1 Tax=Eumeta variegata TaxID=151549 RepID=A0A4C1UBB4_EUMVA|nr:hypothetical protein EVAR_22255_1 [Eumeta japonica]